MFEVFHNKTSKRKKKDNNSNKCYFERKQGRHESSLRSPAWGLCTQRTDLLVCQLNCLQPIAGACPSYYSQNSLPLDYCSRPPLLYCFVKHPLCQAPTPSSSGNNCPILLWVNTFNPLMGLTSPPTSSPRWLSPDQWQYHSDCRNGLATQAEQISQSMSASRHGWAGSVRKEAYFFLHWIANSEAESLNFFFKVICLHRREDPRKKPPCDTETQPEQH